MKFLTPGPARYLMILLMAGTSLPLWAQNLVLNHSFETVDPCPMLSARLCEGYALPWDCPNDGTTDLYHACGGNNFGVPVNNAGYQEAHDGEGYIGMFCRWGANGREYAQAPLSQPLVADQWYNVYFYVVKSHDFCAIERIGAYFSSTVFYQPGFTLFDYEPQVESDVGYLTDTMNWILVSGCFQAEGGEAFITIGNFRNDTESPVEPGCDGNLSYYLIDDIHVEEGTPPEEIFFELGDPVEACFSYEIDPNHPGPYYYWSNGSTQPSIEVTTTGMYVLTITDGCSVGIDSVLVTILGNQPPVDLGPEAVMICEGESYNITLDPTLFEYEWQDGTISPNYNITDAGTYSVTLSDGCNESSDEVTVSVMTPPHPFSIGDDVILCPDEEVIYAVDPSAGDIEWQDGSTDPTYTALTDGVYTVTISNECGEVSDEATVTSQEPPEVDLGPPDLVLCTGQTLELAIDPGLGEIEWQDGSTDPTFIVGSAGMYEVTVINQCGTGYDAVNVAELQTPYVDLGPDLTPCEGQSILLEPDMIDAEYDWQDHSNATTFEVTTTGVYILTITNDCGVAIDTVSITYSPYLTAPAFGPDVQLCPGESIVLMANNPGANIMWQDQSTEDTLLVNTAGTYWVQASNICSTVADTINVIINSDPPEIDLPTQLSLCAGASITLDAGITGVTYLWNDQSQLQQLVVNTPGMYSLTVANSCGSDVDTVEVIDGGQAPVVELGPDIELCPGEVFTINPSHANVNTWLWQDGSTQPTYTVSTADTIIAVVNNNCGSAQDSLEVSMLPPVPIVSLGGDTALCAQETYTLTLGIPDVSIVWHDGSTAQDYTASSDELIYVTIANVCGESSDTVVISAFPDIPPLYLGVDQSLCPGELITISPGIDDVSYAWQDGSTDTIFHTTQADTIVLTISNACGTSTDTLEIIESTQGPDVDLGPDVLACEGEVITLASGISGVDYLWQDGSTQPDLVTAQSGTFVLEVSNNCGTDIDTVLVDIHGTAPVVAIGPDTLLCDHATLTLHADTDAETALVWQDGTAGDSYVLSDAGVYHLTATSRCGMAADTIVITALQSPAPFTLGQDTVLCPQESITLQVPDITNAWQWHDGFTLATRVVDEAGVFGLVISNACGEVSDSMVVSFDDRIPVLDIDSSIIWCIGDTILLDAAQAFPANYQWSTGATSASIFVRNLGAYHVDVTVPCASAAADVEIIPDPDCHVESGIYIPNVFSPNGDGINDLFSIFPGQAIRMQQIEGTIYDRWGNVVFVSTEIPFAWDGRFGGETMMPGVYVYRVVCMYEVAGRSFEEVYTGDVTLVR